MAELKVAKRALRKKIGELLKTLNEQQIRHESEVVHNKVLQHEWYRKAGRISVYVSSSGEISTDSIIKHAMAEGKSVFIPFFEKGVKIMKMVHLKDEEDFERLGTTLWGIRQHHASRISEVGTDEGPFDLVIMPGVAFTKSGKRLGHGMGYYDRFLSNHALKFGKPSTISLALAPQIVREEELPVSEFDVNVDCVISAN